MLRFIRESCVLPCLTPCLAPELRPEGTTAPKGHRLVSARPSNCDLAPIRPTRLQGRAGLLQVGQGWECPKRVLFLLDGLTPRPFWCAGQLQYRGLRHAPQTKGMDSGQPPADVHQRRRGIENPGGIAAPMPTRGYDWTNPRESYLAAMGMTT